MIVVAAFSACVILAALAVFQLCLIAGAPIGRFAWGGQSDVLPAALRVGSAVSVVLYGVFALIILQRAGITAIFGSERFVQVAVWVLFGYFLLGVVMNGISRSRAERKVMVPVTIVLAGLCLILALA